MPKYKLLAEFVSHDVKFGYYVVDYVTHDTPPTQSEAEDILAPSAEGILRFARGDGWPYELRNMTITEVTE